MFVITHSKAENWNQSYKRNSVLKKSKFVSLVLNFLTMHYLNLDYMYYCMYFYDLNWGTVKDLTNLLF